MKTPAKALSLGLLSIGWACSFYFSPGEYPACGPKGACPQNCVCLNGKICVPEDPNLGPDFCKEGPIDDECTGGQTQCDDGDYCTVNDFCQDGDCWSGTSRNCDDNDPCTTDSCDSVSKACKHAPATIPGADEGPFGDPSCANNLDDDCDGESDLNDHGCCGCLNAGDCDDGNECTEEFCNTCLCSAQSISDGSPCGTSGSCASYSCRGGLCIGAQVECPATGVCMTAACVEGHGCMEIPQRDGTKCSDGFFCTVGEHCSGGSCGGGTPMDCSSSLPCTIGFCNEISKTCDSGSTTEGPAGHANCFNNQDDDCDSKVDELDPDCHLPCTNDVNCDDGNPCTLDFCDGAECTAEFEKSGAFCNDLLFCNGKDACDGSGSCLPNSSNPCGLKTCDEESGVCRIPGFLTLALGNSHSCAVAADGLVYCWGSDKQGELGNGADRVASQIPVAIASFVVLVNPLPAVAAGGSHACYWLSSGDTYCWGGNQEGQLGDPDSAPDAAGPVAVHRSELPEPGIFTRISGGAYHTCGIANQGSAYCWGSNASGQLGNGGNDPNSGIPVAVDTSSLPEDLRFARIAAGGNHTCAITVDGKVYCWGDDSFGQLGNGSHLGTSATPVAVDDSLFPGLAFAEITVGGSHTCAILTTGGAYCWGNNTTGQLGNGSKAISQSPVAVTMQPPNPAVVFIAIAAGSSHTCALASGGTAYCWGSDRLGQLGNGESAGDSSQPGAVAPSQPNQDLTFAQIAAGADHTCAATAAGTSYCWGSDSDGQLGDGGTSVDSQTPVAIQTISAVSQPAPGQ